MYICIPQMWVWLYGLSISLFLLLKEYGISNGISLLPLIFLSLAALLEFIFSICKHSKLEDWQRWVNSGFLFSLSFVLLVLISLQIYGNISFTTFFVMLALIVLTLSILFAIMKGEYMAFTNSPMHLRIAKIISYIATVLTYLFFYGVEYSYMESWTPLLPFVISSFAEIYIFFMLYQYGIPTIRREVTTKAAVSRLTYTISIQILLLCAILHYTLVNEDKFLYGAAAITYFIGTVLVLLNSKSKLCKNLDCFEKPKYKELDNNDLGTQPIEDGVDNGDNKI